MAKEKNEQLNNNGNRRGMSPKSRENLRKGHKPNKRASLEFSITVALRKLSLEACPERFLEPEDYGKGFTWRDAVAKRIWIEAAKGNYRVYPELLDRIDGKVLQPIGGEDGEIIFRVIQDR